MKRTNGAGGTSSFHSEVLRAKELWGDDFAEALGIPDYEDVNNAFRSLAEAAQVALAAIDKHTTKAAAAQAAMKGAGLEKLAEFYRDHGIESVASHEFRAAAKSLVALVCQAGYLRWPGHVVKLAARLQKGFGEDGQVERPVARAEWGRLLIRSRPVLAYDPQDQVEWWSRRFVDPLLADLKRIDSRAENIDLGQLVADARNEEFDELGFAAETAVRCGALGTAEKQNTPEGERRDTYLRRSTRAAIGKAMKWRET